MTSPHFCNFLPLMWSRHYHDVIFIYKSNLVSYGRSIEMLLRKVLIIKGLYKNIFYIQSNK